MWITGQVVDDDGRRLSGVTIEASCSPDGRPRAVVTNDQGCYVLQGLRPGAYTITFVLSGFSTFRRTTETLTNFVVTINARLQSRRFETASDH
jgi:protocatechuate 3,4-dioxygenase beta subunit